MSGRRWQCILPVFCLSLGFGPAGSLLLSALFLTVLLHVIFGRPTCLFPSGCHSITILHSLFLSILSTCISSTVPSILLLHNLPLIVFMPVIYDTVMFLRCCAQRILFPSFWSFSGIWIRIYPASPLLLQVHILYWTHQHLSCSVFLFEIFISLKKGCHALFGCFLMPSVTAQSNFHGCDGQTPLHRPLLHFSSSIYSQNFLLHATPVPLFLHCLPVGRPSSVCARNLIKQGLTECVVSKIKSSCEVASNVIFCPSVVLPSPSRQWARTETLTRHNFV